MDAAFSAVGKMITTVAQATIIDKLVSQCYFWKRWIREKRAYRLATVIIQSFTAPQGN
jgi:hypothetical protein